MLKKVIKNIGYTSGFCLFLLIAFVIRVVAEEDGGVGDGGEIGDLATGFGIAGIVLFAFATLTGVVIFLNQRPPFQALFKKWKVKMKIFFKIHHPFTIAAIGTWVGHGLALIYGGVGELSSSGLNIAWVAIVLLLSGLLFPTMKGAKKRKVMRYIHLFLMITIAILIIVHLAGGD